MRARYFRISLFSPLGKKVIYFSDSKSEGFSYWANDKNKTPGTMPWKFREVRAWRGAREIKRSTAKRYIKHIP